jgi:ubiquinone/menaquinone biosynthesis C-methylase UbiE
MRSPVQLLLRSVLAASLLLGLVAGPECRAEDRHPVTGRRYADVMGVGGAAWLDRRERLVEENPKLAVTLLDLRPGMTVADVGAGSGYYTVLLARAVGTGGKVYANDIQPGMLRLLERKMSDAGLANVERVLGSEADPKLPGSCCDLILLVDVYHEFSQPRAMLRKLKDALKPDGRLVLLEYRKEDPSVPIREEHKMSVAEAKAELEHEGFRLEKVLPDLPWQHMLFFRR